VTLGPLPVIIGSGASTTAPLSGVTSPGTGIYCQGTATSPASLSDVSGGSGTVLEIDSQDTGHATKGTLHSDDFCTITLSQKSIFGLPPPCPSPKVDGEGLLIQGSSTVSLTGATIECNYNHGFDIGETPTAFTGSPTVTLAKSLIQYTGQTGLKVNDGTVSATNTSMYHCRFGTVLGGTGSLDLSGGGNVAACNTDKEPGSYNTNGGTANGINVWNDSAAASIDASNMGWDTNPPDYWTCTDAANGSTASACTCVSGPCVGMNIAPTDGAAAVTASNTSATPIVLTNPSLQSKYICN